MYSLLPITEDERVAKAILLSEKPDVVIQLVDVKNLERMLPLTLELMEAELPVILDLNMVDEAGNEDQYRTSRGGARDPRCPHRCDLEGGLDALKERILDRRSSEPRMIQYHPLIEGALERRSDIYLSHLSAQHFFDLWGIRPQRSLIKS